MKTVKQDLSQALRAAQCKAHKYATRLYQVELEARQLQDALQVLSVYADGLRDLLAAPSDK